ncbi:OmpA family protein [Flavobacterium sp.]|uniref:OmpA family protein n=1 Tax=Flavobacterium sp. TaxID=239 RepID=UPI002628F905|nr:OmpA family protein [Flavobacterium sp.]
MREEVIIYKGELHCQFVDLGKESISHSYKISRIKLEPRFRLFDAQAVKEFPLSLQDEHSFYIHQVGENMPVECHFNSNTTENGRYFASEILLFLKPEQPNLSILDFEKTLLNQNKNTNFLSTNLGNQHGIINGTAYCKVVRRFDENNVELTQTNQNSTSLSQNKGCLLGFADLMKPIFSYFFGFNSWLKNLINRFTSRALNTSIINDQPTNAGCFNPMLPTGCTSSGCSQFGCGCLSLILALGLLFWLIWCVLLGNCNKEAESRNTETTVIHDTIYIEVNKEKIDTIVKKDTIIYEDKTTKTKVSVVSLPNVQFEQSKAKLLNSSKEELDRLTKHLIENEQVKAEIIGHTDNLGDDQVNLKLSQERAEAVRQYLIDGGVAGDRVKAIGKGESEPKTTNETPEGRAMNRRVEVRLSETEKENVTKQRIKKNPNK